MTSNRKASFNSQHNRLARARLREVGRQQQAVAHAPEGMEISGRYVKRNGDILVTYKKAPPNWLASLSTMMFILDSFRDEAKRMKECDAHT